MLLNQIYIYLLLLVAFSFNCVQSYTYINVVNYKTSPCTEPIKVVSLVDGVCYKAATFSSGYNSFMYIYNPPANTVNIVAYSDSTCTTTSHTFNSGSPNICYGNLQGFITSEPLLPVSGYSYYERIPFNVTGCQGNELNGRVVSTLDNCMLNDIMELTSQTLSYSKPSLTGSPYIYLNRNNCVDTFNETFKLDSCPPLLSTSYDIIYNTRTMPDYVIDLNILDSNFQFTVININSSFDPLIPNYNITYQIGDSPIFSACLLLPSGVNCTMTTNPGMIYTLDIIPSFGVNYLSPISYSQIKSLSFPILPYVSNLQFDEVTTDSVTFSYSVDGGFTDKLYQYNVYVNNQLIPSCSLIQSCQVGNLTFNSNVNVSVSVNNALYTSQIVSQLTTLLPPISTPTFLITTNYTSWMVVEYNIAGGYGFVDVQVYVNDTVECENPSGNSCNIVALESSTYIVKVVATNGNYQMNSTSELVKMNGNLAAVVASFGVTTKTINVTMSSIGGNSSLTSFYPEINGIINPGCVGKTECDYIYLIPDTEYNITVHASCENISVYQIYKVRTFKKINSLNAQLDNQTSSSLSIHMTVDGGVPGSNYFSVGLVSNGGPTVLTSCVNQLDGFCIITGLNSATTYDIQINVTSEGDSITIYKQFTTLGGIEIFDIQLSQFNMSTVMIEFEVGGVIPPDTRYTYLYEGNIIPDCTNITAHQCYYNGEFPVGYYATFSIQSNSANQPYYRADASILIYSLPTPVVATPGTVDSESVIITWSPTTGGYPSNQTTYSVDISLNGGLDVIPVCQDIEEINGLECVVDNLFPDTTYYIYVNVESGSFNPITSAGISITTLPDTTVHPCPNNCSGKGECDEGTCDCFANYNGDACEIYTNPSDNEENSPSHTSMVASDNQVVASNGAISFSFNLNDIVEVDVQNNVVFTLSLSELSWIPTYSNQSIIPASNTSTYNLTQTVTTFTTTDLPPTVQQKVQSISITFTQFKPNGEKSTTLDSYPMTFAGDTFNVKYGSIKYGIEINQWSFQTKLNILHVSTAISPPSVKGCGKDTGISTQFSNASSINTLILKDSIGNQVYGRLLNRAILDGVYYKISHTMKKSKSSNSILIYSVIPYFKKSTILDPDFSLLVNMKESTDQCSTDTTKSTTWKKITIGVVIGVAGLLALVGAFLYLKAKKIYRIRVMSSKLRVWRKQISRSH